MNSSAQECNALRSRLYQRNGTVRARESKRNRGKTPTGPDVDHFDRLRAELRERKAVGKMFSDQLLDGAGAG
jgi:hypothetical protein